MIRSSASVFFSLRRIGRLRSVRALAFVLALMLVAGNVAAAAAPVFLAASEHGGHALSQAAAGSHCMHEDGKSADARNAAPHHGQGCCAGKACACVNACSGLVAATMPLAIALPQLPIVAVRPPSAYASFSTRLLRPPIA